MRVCNLFFSHENVNYVFSDSFLSEDGICRELMRCLFLGKNVFGSVRYAFPEEVSVDRDGRQVFVVEDAGRTEGSKNVSQMSSLSGRIRS